MYMQSIIRDRDDFLQMSGSPSEVCIVIDERDAKSAADLAAEGWEKRATYSEPRLSELVEMYEESGYEVYLQPYNPAEESGCASCLNVAPEEYRTLYTRKAGNDK